MMDLEKQINLIATELVEVFKNNAPGIIRSHLQSILYQCKDKAENGERFLDIKSSISSELLPDLLRELKSRGFKIEDCSEDKDYPHSLSKYVISW